MLQASGGCDGRSRGGWAASAGGYRYLDFEDNGPYLGDDSGSVELVSLGVGWAF